MSTSAIRIRKSTATETKGSGSRLLAQLSEPGESLGEVTASWMGTTGRAAELCLSLMDYLESIGLLIRHRRQEPLSVLRDVGAQVYDIETEGLQVGPAWFEDYLEVVRAFRRAYIPENFVSVLISPSSFAALSTAAGFPCQTDVERPEGELDTLDGDFRIQTSPSCRSEWITVEFVEGSYRAPRIIDDPED